MSKGHHLWFPFQLNSSQVVIHHHQCVSFQAADAVYDAKYKQLATSPACRKPGLQDLMQYDINT